MCARGAKTPQLSTPTSSKWLRTLNARATRNTAILASARSKRPNKPVAMKCRAMASSAKKPYSLSPTNSTSEAGMTDCSFDEILATKVDPLK